VIAPARGAASAIAAQGFHQQLAAQAVRAGHAGSRGFTFAIRTSRAASTGRSTRPASMA